MIGINKDESADPDVRPIAMGEVLRRVSAKCARRLLLPEFQEALGPEQVGVGTLGAVEAVIMKCTQRMPLTFANHALGTVLRTLNPEATAVMWAQTKRQRKAVTGSSSYVTEVTGTFSSMEQASAAWHDHYQQRKQTNVSDVISGQVGETIRKLVGPGEDLLVHGKACVQRVTFHIDNLGFWKCFGNKPGIEEVIRHFLEE